MVETRQYDRVGRNKIRKVLSECKKVADLGCNQERIREDAFGYDLDVEVNPDFVCDFNSDEFEFQGKYDGICMSHLLEHIIDIRTLLSECYDTLQLGGKIAIIVPNGETVPFETLGDSEGTHEMLFTPITLRLYLQNAGFKNVKTEYYDRPNAWKKTKGIFARGDK